MKEESTTSKNFLVKLGSILVLPFFAFVDHINSKGHWRNVPRASFFGCYIVALLLFAFNYLGLHAGFQSLYMLRLSYSTTVHSLSSEGFKADLPENLGITIYCGFNIICTKFDGVLSCTGNKNFTQVASIPIITNAANNTSLDLGKIATHYVRNEWAISQIFLIALLGLSIITQFFTHGFTYAHRSWWNNMTLAISYTALAWGIIFSLLYIGKTVSFGDGFTDLTNFGLVSAGSSHASIGIVLTAMVFVVLGGASIKPAYDNLGEMLMALNDYDVE